MGSPGTFVFVRQVKMQMHARFPSDAFAKGGRRDVGFGSQLEVHQQVKSK